MNFIKQYFNKKTLTFSFFLLLFAEFIYNISGYVIQIGLGRILTTEEFGRFSLVTSVVTLITLLASRGIPTAMMKKISENKNDFALVQAIKKVSAKLQFYLIFLLTIIFYFSAPLLAKFYGDTSLTPLFQFNALVIPAFAPRRLSKTRMYAVAIG
jgi:O-antigen/teichoic acid export membrane protein